MARKNSNKEGHQVSGPSTAELLDNELRHRFRLGDITWIKMRGSSWWPAQVVDEAYISDKPEKKMKDDLLVRLYGTCEYLYVDPWKCNAEFEIMLKQENKSITEAFQEALEQELSHVKSLGDSDEEALESEGEDTSESTKGRMQKQDSEQNQEASEVATARTSARKIRKQEGLRRYNHTNVKEPATLEAPEDQREKQDGTEQNQEARKIATTGTSVLKRRKKEGFRQSSCSDKEPGIDKAARDDFPEVLQGKKQKQDVIVQNQEASKMATTGTSAMKGRKQEGLRRSGRINAKEKLTETQDITSPLQDTSASEDAIKEIGNGTSKERYQHENGSMPAGSLATDAEIRAMVRDILFKGKFPRQDEAEVADTDEVSNEVYDVRNMKKDAPRKRKYDDSEEHLTKTDNVNTATPRERGNKRSENTVEGVKACNGTLRARKGERDNTTPVKPKDMKGQEAAMVRNQAVNGFPNVSNQKKDGTEKGKISNVNAQVIKKVYTRSLKEATKNARQARNPETAKCDAPQVKTPKGNGSNHVNSIADPTPRKDKAAEESGDLSARQIRVMQSLALIAPSGSPFGRSGLVAAANLEL